ncbi:IDEAL domain-containing protein [Paenibacillus sp. FSL L8-0696]|jgi:uncharacterized protein YpiB (UPF0302 family)|uniref:IDEAL domain-containing protein n=1 Tax=unclassified Paenibacillus TaxID=185978 RepID=UPI0030EEA0F9
MFFIGLYALALNSYIEVVWETAVRNYQIEQLQEQIDLALDNWDAAAFYKYSSELAELKVVQAHGQITYKR